MLGDEVFVGEDAVITSNVKVYPFKTVEAGAIINSSIIWESKGSRSLFGRGGVVGLSNVDMTPELATKVALAFADLAQEGRHDRHLPRFVAVGTHAQAVGDGRAQRRRRQRAGPRDGVGAGDPVRVPLGERRRRA